jgi:uncharacterized protein YndB with AHSA1/START domain
MPARQAIQVKTHITIGKSARTVFEAIVDPEKMSHYFISSGSGRLETGAKVRWEFPEVNRTLELDIQAIEPGRRISFFWQATGVRTHVEIELQPLSESVTVVRVSDSEWSPDEMGIKNALGQMEGWTHFLCCLLAYLEYNIGNRAFFLARV